MKDILEKPDKTHEEMDSIWQMIVENKLLLKVVGLQSLMNINVTE